MMHVDTVLRLYNVKALAKVISALCLMVPFTLGESQAPFVYFAGNPATFRFTLTGTCTNPSQSSAVVFFVSGDLNSEGNPARWLAFPMELCSPLEFDAISYAPGGNPRGTPEVRVYITRSTTTNYPGIPDPLPIPDMSQVVYWTSLGTYPGNPPLTNPPPGTTDEPMLNYVGGTGRYLRTNTLNSPVRLDPGFYFVIIVGDEDYSQCGFLDSSISLLTAAPGGPNLYYVPRGVGSDACNQPGAWELYRTPTYNSTDYPCTRTVNPGLPWREADPFGGVAPFNTGVFWKDYHPPALYNGVLGFRDSRASGGVITGTAIAPGAGANMPSVEVIFYEPNTNHRIARFSMPTSTNGQFTLTTPPVKAGHYDIVVRPIYRGVIQDNCPTDRCITGVAYAQEAYWLGVRIPNVHVTGTTSLGTVTLPKLSPNGDLCVDDADLLEVLFNFGTTGTGLPADIDNNGTVDDADLLEILFNFGRCGEDGSESCGGNG